ncbi:MAG: hypothetical protein HYW65_02605 [Candidatus Liptonbacteria bacterium]|nr:hypothetical protein [Candidatus Liptonbacteria bacterium]
MLETASEVRILHPPQWAWKNSYIRKSIVGSAPEAHPPSAENLTPSALCGKNQNEQ